ncbi:ABC transporter permease [Natronoglomus mannanivorans]|uniref:ABC transporter permease n=1 Tax=Natronoglomus mannanivorans TaxID=2979990 RepID=A0AAP2YZJ3_9EURY|nr:ABC transporter permease [Halobacteria archaeon AArc-xg1-1]
MTASDRDRTDPGRAEKSHESAVSAIPDGGTVNSPFEVVSEYEETRRDRLRKLYDTYVYAPISIIKRDWRAQIGFTIVLFYVFMGTIGVYLIESTYVTEGPALAQPFETWEYPLGTDDMGRDLFASVVHSTSEMLKMILAGGLFTVTLGTVVGGIAGYKGGVVDTVLSSITDVFINLPGLPTVMVLALMLPIHGNPYLIGVLLTIASWGGLARAIRSQVLTLRQEPFTEAARSMGVPSHQIVFRDIVPHLMPFVIINLTNAARRVIFSAAGLYFLGVLPFSNHNWGVTLDLAYSGGAHYRTGALHWFLVPMVAIVGISIGLILLGQSLDRVFNPRVRARHEKKFAESQLEEVDPDSDDDSEPMIGAA